MKKIRKTGRGTESKRSARRRTGRAGRDGDVGPGLGSTAQPPPDRFDLYELCVQSPEYDARMIDAIYRVGKPPRRSTVGRRGSKLSRCSLILGEDFCGTAAIARAWVDMDESRKAVAVDHDREVIERAILSNAQPFSHGGHRHSIGAAAGMDSVARTRIDYLLADARDAEDRADVIALLNFAVCELHDRASLVGYLSHARRRLRKHGRLVCDIYGGADAFVPSQTHRTFDHPAGHEVEYTWEQRKANPLTGMVENAIHFRVRPGRRSKQWSTHRDAFVYHWRLWSIPELREAMSEAGFASTEVFARSAGAITHDGQFAVEALTNPEELDESFSCLVVGRV